MADYEAAYPPPVSASEWCGYSVTDQDGNEQPCNRLATGFRWYQEVEHEDCLDVACEIHENEGGRRIAAAEAALRRERESHAITAQALAASTRTQPPSSFWKDHAEDLQDPEYLEAWNRANALLSSPDRTGGE